MLRVDVRERLLRVATFNAFGLREGWPQRRELMMAGFRDVEPDLVAFQEVVITERYDQVQDVLGDGYHVLHHRLREPDGQGISIASRWPIEAVGHLDLHLAQNRPSGFACSTLLASITVPDPIGTTLFVNHLPDWQLDHELERERQTVLVADAIDEAIASGRFRHVIVAGDLDAAPDAASVRFWTGKQSLSGRSVCYRDAWTAAQPSAPGQTFTPENTLMTTAEDGAWALGLGRRIDYILVRCTDHEPTLRVDRCARLFDEPVDGTWASDHFGVVADLSAWSALDADAP